MADTIGNSIGNNIEDYLLILQRKGETTLQAKVPNVIRENVQRISEEMQLKESYFVKLAVIEKLARSKK